MVAKKVLITSAGTGSAFATAEAVAENFGDKLDLYISDINCKELVSASIFTNNFIQSKPIFDDDYELFITDILNNNNFNFCIPFIDIDIQILASLFSNGSISNKLKLHVTSSDIANICADKLLTYNWLKENRIFTPETFKLDETNLKTGFILKPRKGFGSSIKELNDTILKTINNKSDYIAQEICVKPEITIDVFRNSEKKLFFYVCRERIETKSGVCTKARLFLDDKLAEIALYLADHLGLKYFCFQVMQLNDRWAVTDINPRFGSGTPMGKAIQIDFFSAMIADFLEENPMSFLKPLEREVFITRQYKNILSN